MNELATPAIRDPLTVLHSFIGQWTGHTTTFFEPGNQGDESPWQGKIEAVVGKRYLQYDYVGSMQGERFEGKAILGYNGMTEQFEMVWIDSFHQSTGIMHSKGHEIAAGITLLGSYRAFDHSDDWGWRTDFTLLDANRLTICAYNIDPEGNESLALETIYTRQ